MLDMKCGMIEDTKKGKNFHGIIEILIFIGLFFSSQIVTGILIGILSIFKAIKTGHFDQEKMMEDAMLPMLFGTATMIIIVLIYTKYIQKRSLYSVGFGKAHALKDYIIGYVVGVVMFSTAILILILTNNLIFENASITMFPIVFVFFIGFLIQGASEEVALRGYLMNSLAARHHLVIAVIVNASIFGVLHLGNNNVTFLSILNIILFGLFASFYALKFNNIWGVCALHSAWNFVQGNIFGLEVSGNKMNESLWHFKATGSELLNGGSFGPEGGLAVSIVLIISILVIILLKVKRNNDIVVNE